MTALGEEANPYPAIDFTIDRRLSRQLPIDRNDRANVAVATRQCRCRLIPQF
jgi:hypothetical protein